jgi:hypothetical protein
VAAVQDFLQEELVALEVAAQVLTTETVLLEQQIPVVAVAELTEAAVRVMAAQADLV